MTNAERDAARMLAEVSERGDAVRDATQRNFVEMFLTLGAITLAAVVAAPFATHVDKPGAIAGLAFGDFTITATLVASNNKKLALLAIVLLFAWSNGILALRGKVLFDK